MPRFGRLVSIVDKKPSAIRISSWIYVLNTLAALLISLRYLTVVELPAGGFALVFTGLSFVGHISMLSLAAPALGLPFALLGRRVHTAAIMLLYTVFHCVLITDTVVFQQYRFHLNGMVLNFLLGGAAGEIFAFSGRMLLSIAATVGAVMRDRFA